MRENLNEDPVWADDPEEPAMFPVLLLIAVVGTVGFLIALLLTLQS